MEKLFKQGTKGVSLSIDGKIIGYMLFVTEQTMYGESSVGTYGINESNPCILISHDLVLYVDTFSTHVWDLKTKTHKYTFLFDQVTIEGKIELSGVIEYRYVDGDEESDSAMWEHKFSDEIFYECSPLIMGTRGMYRFTDSGVVDLHFQFKTLDKRK